MIKIKKATYNLFFRPKPEIRKQLSELKKGDHEGLNSILDKLLSMIMRLFYGEEYC